MLNSQAAQGRFVFEFSKNRITQLIYKFCVICCHKVMSLILGVNLPDKLFLAADTRLTHKLNGENFYQDNFFKTFDFGEKINVAVAGSARLASFILQKINKSGIIRNEFIYFRNKIEDFLLEILDEYLFGGGKYEKVVLIFGGYDTSIKKKVNSSIFGHFQSKGIKGKKEVVRQSINHKVVEGLMKEFVKRGMGQITKDTEFEIDSPYSSIFSVEIILPNKPSVRDIDCYKFVMYGPRGLTEKSIPDDILQKLEVNINPDFSGEQFLRQWSLELVYLVKNVTKEHYLETVGGDVITLLLTPHGAVIPTGKVMFYDYATRTNIKISEVIVRDGKFCTRDIHGNIIPYEQIINFDKGGGFEV